MPGYRVISSDSHVMEPPDLWTARIERRFSHRAPYLVREEDGDWWYCEERKFQNLVGGIQPGAKFGDQGQLQVTGLWENVRRGAYIPEEHVKDQVADGVDAAVIYPTVGLLAFSVGNSDLLTAIFRAYNDWLAEFCKPFPHRLKGVAMINLDDVPAGVKEMERCADLGLAGAMISVYPPEERGYDLPDYESFWAAAQDLQIPLSLHSNTNRHGTGDEEFLRTRRQKPAFRLNLDHYVKMSLSHMIFSGVFERYPTLRVGVVEHELSWVPHLLSSMDFLYTQRAIRAGDYRFKGGHAAQRLFPPQRVAEFSGGRRGRKAPGHHRRGPAPVGLGLSPRRVHLPQEPRGP